MTRSGVAAASTAVAALLVAAAVVAGAAEEPDVAAVAGADVEAWTATLDRIETLSRNQPSLPEIDTAYTDLLGVLGKAGAARGRLQATRGRIDEELATLGPAPPEGAPPEPGDVAGLRRQLTARRAAIDTLLKRAEVALARADALGSALRSLRSGIVTRRLLTRGPPPLDPATWPAAAAGLRDVVEMARQELAATQGTRRDGSTLLWILVLALAGAIVARALRRWLARTIGRDPGDAAPAPERRLIAAAAEGTGRSLVILLPAVAVLGLLVDFHLITGRAARITNAVLWSLFLLVAITAHARAAFPGDAPTWRLFPLDDAAAATVRRRLTALAIVAAVAALVRRSLYGLAISPALDSMLAVGITLPLTVILMPLASPRVWHADGTERLRGWGWGLLQLLAGIVVVALPLTALAGWAPLAYEIDRVLVTAAVATILFVITHTLAGAVIDVGFAPAHRTGDTAEPSAAAGATIALWLRFVADVLLAAGAVVTWLLLMGIPLRLVVGQVSAVLTTFEIGSMHFSLADLLIATAGFVAVLTVTRMVHRTLEHRLLPHTEMALGTQQALTTVVSYAGLALAIAVAFGALGLDLSNLALIAGALSVGIGFGLQNVVGNFISGIIMLVERPIKVGDWVVIGGHEGTVRRINVRATEIETFQRSAVLIPNSEVLSSAVVNWTHRDKHGRLDLAVGVAYGSDVEKVRDTLLACARVHEGVASIPPPYVIFKDFGDSALQFELRAYLKNVENRLGVTSDLRFAIDAAFRRAGIEIPFPQRDVHLRDIDRIERVLAGRENPAARGANSESGVATPQGTHGGGDTQRKDQ